MPNRTRRLVNDLTVEDARHLLRNEGGELTPLTIAAETVSIVAVSATIAYAIWQGRVTAWHLALPSLAQYFVLLVAMPLIYAATRLPGLHKDTIGALRLLVGFALIAAIAIGVRARLHELPWRDQLTSDVQRCWRWVTDAEMHWPIMLATLSTAIALPGRVSNLKKFGPPFMGVNLGCAMRLVVILLGCFMLPWAVSSSTRMVWCLWAVLLLAEALALGMHWDLQRRLRKLE